MNPMQGRPPPRDPMQLSGTRRTAVPTTLCSLPHDYLPAPEGIVTTITEVKAPPALTPETVTRVELPAALIVGNRQMLKQRVVDHLAEGKREFVLDFVQCGYVDSSGAGVLVSVAKKIRDAGGSLVLTNVNEDLAFYFEAVKLDTLFDIRRGA